MKQIEANVRKGISTFIALLGLLPCSQNSILRQLKLVHIWKETVVAYFSVLAFNCINPSEAYTDGNHISRKDIR
jgi:hypothetical protein